jgi:hypothetical protein
MSNREKRWEEFETPYAEMSGAQSGVMCKATCQKHPIASMEHTVKKLLQLDDRVAGLRTKSGKELRAQLLTEMEGLAVVAIHDLTRLLWSIRGGYQEPLAD